MNIQRQIWERLPHPATDGERLARFAECAASGQVDRGLWWEVLFGSSQSPEFVRRMNEIQPLLRDAQDWL